MIPISKSKKIIIKLGTGILRSDHGLINNECLKRICHEIKKLKDFGTQVIVVSSGAIGLGMAELKIETRPKELKKLQACAAIGQSQLINVWQNNLIHYDLKVAQILLTQEDLNSDNNQKTVSETIEEILSAGAVPIVNENDTVSAEEIKFGDNDTLSALLAKAMNTDLLIILSNINGLIGADDKIIHLVDEITPKIEDLAKGTNKEFSIGGMSSKISAAKIALKNNCGVFIGSGNDPKLFDKLYNGEIVGTYFKP